MPLPRAKVDGASPLTHPSGERARVSDTDAVGTGLAIDENEIDESLDGLEVELSPEKQQRISDLFARLHVVDFYALLAVPRMAETKAIKRAYNRFVIELHPDRFFRKRLGTFGPKLDAIFVRLTAAHDVLCSPEHRARYDELLRMRRGSLVDSLVEAAVREMAGAKDDATRETVVVDRSVRVSTEAASPPKPMASHASGVQPAARGVSDEDLGRLRELHERRKRGETLEPADGARYDVLRDRFVRAFVAEQHLALREGQTQRRALRVPCAFRLTLSTGGRAHSTITLDLSAQGLATLVGSSLPVSARCELVLHVAPQAIRVGARVVSSVRHGSGNTSFRVSLELDVLEEPAAERLDVLVLDVALRRAMKR